VSATSKIRAVADVKGSSARQLKAAQTRRRMLQAAYQQFCEFGYRATTMDAIAERADVAIQTLYFTFRTKDQLLQAVHEWTVLGDDPTPPPEQPWYRAAVDEPDVHAALRLVVSGASAIFARVAPMLPVFHSVISEPAGATYRNAEALRRSGYEDLIDILRAKAPLSTSLSRARAVDVLFVLVSPDVYRAFVLEAGWPPNRWISAVTARELFRS
jgi:AcrR family transcriptional regulator